MRSNTDEMTPLADMRSRPIYLRAEIYLIGAQLAVLAARRLFQPATLVDDAYIHFR
ncbi:hypothetical protein HYR69_10015, partial [Candidatus Sumerlaeota bacterium]|nr:hypothetical protein [Candidatus Sumerlaeota bacterium]